MASRFQLDRDSCMGFLREFAALTTVSLREIVRQQRRAAALAGVLPTLPRLQRLDLSSNLVFCSNLLFDDQLWVEVLAPALGRSTALHTFHLWTPS